MKKFALAFTIVSMGFGGAVTQAAAKPWYENVKVSGFVDGYYQINFNGLTGAINNPASLSQRALDTRQNEFSFNGAKLGLTTSDEASGVGAELDLLYGPLGTLSVGGPVEQAFMTFGLGPMGLKVGKFVTHLSFEVIDTPANWNYSRSVLFTQVPYYHVGAAATYSSASGLGLMLGVADSNSLDAANDEAKDIMAQISYSGFAGASLFANYYLETNRSAASLQPFENTHYLELIGTYQILPEVNLGADYLYKTTLASADKDPAGNPAGDVSSPKVQGYALYANCSLPVPGLSVTPRFEQLYAPDADGLVNDYTLTVKYAAGPLTHALELRSDYESPAGFLPKASESELKSTQLTLTYGTTYNF